MIKDVGIMVNQWLNIMYIYGLLWFIMVLYMLFVYELDNSQIKIKIVNPSNCFFLITFDGLTFQGLSVKPWVKLGLIQSRPLRL